MIVNFYMSCGHWQEKDCSTTGEQFQIDKRYYAAQGLCDKCWEKLIERRNAEREEMRRKKGETSYMEMENGCQVIGLHNDFSVGGNILHIIRVENGEAVLENVKTGRKSTYGIQALERVVRQYGYTIKKELLEG